MVIEASDNKYNQTEKLPMTGIILAGGKSSRMGRNKAFLDCQGEPLIERSLRVIQSLFSEVLISSNRPELYKKYSVEIIPDNYKDKGPLGGLQACLQVAKYDYSFFVACDMPFLDCDVIWFLAKFTGDVSIVAPKLDKVHPLHAFYKKDCLPIINKNLEANRLKITELFKECTTRIVDEGELAGFSNIKKVLTNINTPIEWQNVQHYLK